MAKEETYVRIDDANLLKITFTKLAKDFARYSNLMIDIKNLSDEKNKKRKEFLAKLSNIEKEFKHLESILPKTPKEKHVVAPHPKAKVKKEKPKPSNELESFDELRSEFERLRKQLEKIKNSV